MAGVFRATVDMVGEQHKFGAADPYVFRCCRGGESLKQGTEHAEGDEAAEQVVVVRGRQHQFQGNRQPTGGRGEAPVLLLRFVTSAGICVAHQGCPG